ncbi:Roadblock/LAMTOR2 domain-containing protein [Plasmodiophora brassicae]|uniref:Roadblock/LAMTOR2 domain-containing protein n=1 Tax=Plasmodiophora brassicae TaxID=37360 RepID=A0A0G4IN61_PLABS|nr:hypothetical protein PBRA_005274 [Plasmodiophora brassicae]SPQ95334.1 unnamed protein product [Plasmodiophora brassicae]
MSVDDVSAWCQGLPTHEGFIVMDLSGTVQQASGTFAASATTAAAVSDILRCSALVVEGALNDNPVRRIEATYGDGTRIAILRSNKNVFAVQLSPHVSSQTDNEIRS